MIKMAKQKPAMSVIIIGIFVACSSVSWALDQWVRVVDPQMQSLTILSLAYTAQHPTYPQGIFLAGTLDHGLWRSTDGDHWTQSGLTTDSISAIAIAPDGTIYAGTGDGTRNPFPPYRSVTAALYRSSDAASWEAINNGLTHPLNPAEKLYNTHFLAVNSQGVVFVSLDGYVFRSADRGASWTILSLAWGLTFSAIWIDTENHIILGDNYGMVAQARLLRVSPDGATILNSFELPAWDRPMTFGLNQNTGSLFVGLVPTINHSRSIYRSADLGQSWTFSAQVGEGVLTDNPPGYWYPVVSGIASRPQGDLFIAASAGVLRSIDDGATWENANRGLGAVTCRALIATADGTLYAGTASGVFRSTYLVPVGLCEFRVE